MQQFMLEAGIYDNPRLRLSVEGMLSTECELVVHGEIFRNNSGVGLRFTSGSMRRHKPENGIRYLAS